MRVQTQKYWTLNQQLKRRNMIKQIIFGTLLLSLTFFPALAMGIDGKLTIVTSYPPDTTNTVKKVFEAKYPGIQVEMLKKKTTAGIKYLQETAAHNTSDMFWASAPDAFEVLKGDNLLQKYEVKVGGIPEKVGAYQCLTGFEMLHIVFGSGA